MKHYVLLAGVLVRLAACAQHADNPASHTRRTTVRETTMENHNTNEKRLIEVTDKLIQLMIERDTAAMNQIVDKGFTLTHMTGYVQSKADWFAEVEKESMKYFSAEKVNRRVNINGNRATVTQQNRVDARIWGSRHTWRLQQVYQLEKRNGHWIILNSVASTF